VLCQAENSDDTPSNDEAMARPSARISMNGESVTGIAMGALSPARSSTLMLLSRPPAGITQAMLRWYLSVGGAPFFKACMRWK
jgi:hypothetical protein